jgi:hypothetical protein
MVVDVGVVEHDLAPAAQLGAMVGLRLDEAVHEAALEVLRARPLGQLEPGVADRGVDAVDVERVLHHAVADAVAPAGARPVAHQDDLSPRQLHSR